MYRCPHCGERAIPWTAQFAFSSRTTCPHCGTTLKMHIGVSNFLLPVYFLGRATLALAFGIRFDAGMFWEMAIVAVVGVLQVWLTGYEQVHDKLPARPHREPT